LLNLHLILLKTLHLSKRIDLN